MNKLALLALLLSALMAFASAERHRVRGNLIKRHLQKEEVEDNKKNKEENNKEDVPVGAEEADATQEPTESDATVEPEETAIEETVTEGAEEAPQDTTGSTTAPAEGDAEPESSIGETQRFNVPLNPFSLTVEGISADELAIDVYLENHMKQTLPNLVDIVLTVTSEESGRRRLNTINYEGVATFMGPPQQSEAVVNNALTAALEDEVALKEFLENPPEIDTGAVSPDTSSTSSSSSQSDAESTYDGPKLSTTGLVIVILVACLVVICFFCWCSPVQRKSVE